MTGLLRKFAPLAVFIFALCLGSFAQTGLAQQSAAAIGAFVGSNGAARGSIQLPATASLSWVGPNFLFSGGANTLELRNSTNPQTLRLYNTYTDASNNERMNFGFSSNIAFIRTAASGTGTARAFRWGAGGADFWELQPTTGTFLGITTTGVSGYAVGVGGAITQLTSKSQGVTLSLPTGQITMHNAALLAAAKVSFVVTNTLVIATDVPSIVVASGGTANAYRASVTAVAAGSFTITVENITAGSLSEAPIITFVLHRGAAS